MKRALVTGATGMLGSYVVDRLLDDGWTVRALVRRPGSARRLVETGVDCAPGDMTNAEDVRRAVVGCEAVVHAAAFIGAGGRWEEYRRGNVGGTANVVAACSEVGARLVHVSSTAVFGQARYRDPPTDERAPLPRLPERDVYGRSKQDAERVVLDAVEEDRLRATVVRPPVMYGRYDRQFAPRIGPVFRAGVFPVVGTGTNPLPIVHAASVADGITRSLARDVALGRVYHLTHDFDLDVVNLAKLAGQGLDRRIWTPRVPFVAGRVGFAALRAVLTVGGRSDLAGHVTGTFRMLTRPNPFSSERARRELDWAPPIPPEIGLPDAFQWWATHRNGSTSTDGTDE